MLDEPLDEEAGVGRGEVELHGAVGQRCQRLTAERDEGSGGDELLDEGVGRDRRFGRGGEFEGVEEGHEGLELDEVFEDLEADCAGFFGVELYAHDVVAFDGGGEVSGRREKWLRRWRGRRALARSGCSRRRTPGATPRRRREVGAMCSREFQPTWGDLTGWSSKEVGKVGAEAGVTRQGRGFRGLRSSLRRATGDRRRRRGTRLRGQWPRGRRR